MRFGGVLLELLGAYLGALGGVLLGTIWRLFGRFLGASGGKIGVEHRHGRFLFFGRAVLEASWGRFSGF